MNRFTIDKLNSFQKGLCMLHARVLMSGTTPLLQKWNYPALNTGSLGTYSNAPTSVVGSGGIGTAQIGCEGVKSITRTGAGLWTVVLQDNYQRILGAPLVTQSLAGGSDGSPFTSWVTLFRSSVAPSTTFVSLPAPIAPSPVSVRTSRTPALTVVTPV